MAKVSPLVYAGPGNFRSLWLLDQLKGLAGTDFVYEFEGFRPYEGSECAVMRFWLAKQLDRSGRSRIPSRRFWADLQRGGFVVRREELQDGDHVSQVTSITLQRFEGPAGRQVWLPSSGKIELLMWAGPDKKLFYGTNPSVAWHYTMLPNSLRIDQGLPDSALTVNLKPGDFVSDQIRQARYEFGQYLVRAKAVTRRPTDAEVKAEVDRMLGDSERMARELKATTPTQEATGWWRHWPWAVAVLALLAAGLIVLRQRRG